MRLSSIVLIPLSLCVWFMVATLAAFALFPAIPNPAPRAAEIPARLGWYEVPESKLQAVCPANDFNHWGYAFASRCSGVLRAWNGGIADTQRNRMIVWGGGHNDYAGNEVYAFDLASLQWQRLNDPSPITPCEESTPDRKPNSRHTYGGLAYLADVDRMFSFGGVLHCSHGIGSNATWTLGLDALDWVRMDPARGGSPNDENHGAVTAYDPNSKLVYVYDRASGFWSYDYHRNSYRRLNRDTSLSLHTNAVIDATSELFLTFGDGEIRAISLAARSGHSTQDRSKANGCDGLARSSSPGLAYDPVQDRVIGWPDFGPAVYLYDSHTNSCSTLTFPGDAPLDSAHTGAPRSSNGTFGRFQYFPASGVFVLVNDSDLNVRTLRLTARNSEVRSAKSGIVQ